MKIALTPQNLLSTTLLLILTTLLTACGSNPSQVLNAGGYKTARAQSSLEIPPDLINTTSSSIKRAEQSAQSGQTVLPAIEGLKIQGEGSQRYLLVSANADDAWAKTVDFANKNNLPILTESKRNGILETDWIGDTSTESKTDTRLRSMLGNLAGRPPVNDKYKFWLERLGDNETAVHVDHSQLTQRVIEPKNEYDNVEVRWQEQPGTDFKSLQMLRDMIAFFSGTEAAEEIAKVKLLTENTEQIELAMPLNIAWTSVGNAVRKTRYTIDDVKRDKSLYVIKQPKASGGILSRFSIRQKYGVLVEAISEEKSRVTVTTKRGKHLDRKDALPILYAITGELRKQP